MPLKYYVQNAKKKYKKQIGSKKLLKIKKLFQK